MGLEQDLLLIHLHLASKTGHMVLPGDVGPIQDHNSPVLPHESHLQLSIPTPLGDQASLTETRTIPTALGRYRSSTPAGHHTRCPENSDTRSTHVIRAQSNYEDKSTRELLSLIRLKIIASIISVSLHPLAALRCAYTNFLLAWDIAPQTGFTAGTGIRFFFFFLKQFSTLIC